MSYHQMQPTGRTETTASILDRICRSRITVLLLAAVVAVAVALAGDPVSAAVAAVAAAATAATVVVQVVQELRTETTELLRLAEQAERRTLQVAQAAREARAVQTGRLDPEEQVLQERAEHGDITLMGPVT